MKLKSLFFISIALVFSACKNENVSVKDDAVQDPPIKDDAIKDELMRIELTSKDNTQPDEIRRSAATFEKILKIENSVLKQDWIRAHADMLAFRNETTILTYIAFLKGLEKRFPDKLPSVEEYDLLKERTSKAKFIEVNVARTVLLVGESIKGISLYGDPSADAEVESVLSRLEEKHGNTETGKKILEFLKMVRQQGLNDRSRGIKPWESPKRQEGDIHMHTH